MAGLGLGHGLEDVMTDPLDLEIPEDLLDFEIDLDIDLDLEGIMEDLGDIPTLTEAELLDFERELSETVGELERDLAEDLTKLMEDLRKDGVNVVNVR